MGLMPVYDMAGRPLGFFPLDPGCVIALRLTQWFSGNTAQSPPTLDRSIQRLPTPAPTAPRTASEYAAAMLRQSPFSPAAGRAASGGAVSTAPVLPRQPKPAKDQEHDPKDVAVAPTPKFTVATEDAGT